MNGCLTHPTEPSRCAAGCRAAIHMPGRDRYGRCGNPPQGRRNRPAAGRHHHENAGTRGARRLLGLDQLRECAGGRTGAGRLGQPSRRKSNLLDNGDFERGLAGWSPFWSRQTAAGTAAVDTKLGPSGQDLGSHRTPMAAKTGAWRPPKPCTSTRVNSSSFSGWVNLAGKGIARSPSPCAMRPARSSTGPTPADRLTRPKAGGS